MIAWRRNLVLCMLWLLVLLPATASAQDSGATDGDQFAEVRTWLDRMSEAMRVSDYQGTFVYVRGEDVETLRLTHVHRDGRTMERLVTLSGPSREIIRDAKGVRARVGDTEQAVTGNDMLLSGAVLPELSTEALTEARGQYLFEMGGEGRIAGYRAMKLSITPKDRYRFGYELWLEAESALLLRWVLFDSNRRSLAKLMFTELVMGDSVDLSGLEAAASDPSDSAPAALRSAASVSEQAPPDARAWDISAATKSRTDKLQLPPGFRLAAHSADPGRPEFEHLVFSDGLASVSVYLEPEGGQPGMPDGLSRLGTTSAWVQRRGDRRITVVGETPALTLKTIGHAFLRAPVSD